jgi:hypothetical protein
MAGEGGAKAIKNLMVRRPAGPSRTTSFETRLSALLRMRVMIFLIAYTLHPNPSLNPFDLAAPVG